MTRTLAGFVSIAFVVLVVAGCATTPDQPYYTSAVKDIGGYDMNYWIQQPPTVGVRIPVPEHRGCAAVELTIDSNGTVWDPKVLRFIGPSGFDSQMQRYVSSFHYRASVHNPEKVPVRMTFNVAVASQTRRSGASTSELKADAGTTATSDQSCLANLQTQGVVPPSA